MTAEVFLAALLGCLVAIIVTCVFFKTVYMPVQSWLLRRAFRQPLGNSGDFVSLGSDDVCRAVPGVLDKAAFESRQREFEAQEALGLAALDVSEGYAARLHDAARAFRDATTPRQRKQMRAMAAYRKAAHEPDDPV